MNVIRGQRRNRLVFIQRFQAFEAVPFQLSRRGTIISEVTRFETNSGKFLVDTYSDWESSAHDTAMVSKETKGNGSAGLRKMTYCIRLTLTFDCIKSKRN